MNTTRSSGTVPPKSASKERMIVPPIEPNQLGVYDMISYDNDGNECFGMITEVHENKTDV